MKLLILLKVVLLLCHDLEAGRVLFSSHLHRGSHSSPMVFALAPCCYVGEEHFPPLKLYGIPARYANATYTAASKAGQLDLVQRDLDAFQHVRITRFCTVLYCTVLYCIRNCSFFSASSVSPSLSWKVVLSSSLTVKRIVVSVM